MTLLLIGCAGLAPGAEPEPTSPAHGEPAGDWRYALVIDASSSASTLFVYQWRPGKRLPRIEAAPYPLEADGEPWSRRVRPGLSDYSGRPPEAARSIQPLIDYALEKIPAPQRAATPLHLWATAGLRRLGAGERDDLLAAVADALEATPFAAAPPRVLSGAEEGIYGWLTANYLLGHLEHGGPFPTVGALDLGGASTQITFAPLDYPRRGGQVVRLGGNTYHLYTHSYLGAGQDVARDESATPDCFPSGYPMADGATGRGDLANCRAAIRQRLETPCAEGPCSGLGVYQPPVYGDFLAFSVYAYAAEFFDLGARLTPTELETAATAFCATSWAERLAAEPAAADNPYLPRYCFAAAYIIELLTEGFGFSPSTERISAPLRVQGAETGWTLGALLYELAGDAD